MGHYYRQTLMADIADTIPTITLPDACDQPDRQPDRADGAQQGRSCGDRGREVRRAPRRGSPAVLAGHRPDLGRDRGVPHRRTDRRGSGSAAHHAAVHRHRGLHDPGRAVGRPALAGPARSALRVGARAARAFRRPGGRHDRRRVLRLVRRPDAGGPVRARDVGGRRRRSVSRSALASTPARSRYVATTSEVWPSISPPALAARGARRGPRLEHGEGSARGNGSRVRGPGRTRTERCARPLAFFAVGG